MNTRLSKWRRVVLALLLLVIVLATSSFAPQGETEELAAASFFRAADETLARVVEITGLTPKHPIARSLKSRDEIRAFIVAELHEDAPPDKMRADQIALEKFGLIPKGFPLEKFTVDLLTEQVAALYDPKKKEFYIADWIPVELQRTVMAHELTHALEDQYFDLDKWLKEVRSNDDALLARTAVAEGSATAVMLQYLLGPEGKEVRDLPEAEELVRAAMQDQLDTESVFGQAPRFLRESLLFPYLDGVSFTQRFLARNGWKTLDTVFKNPPASSQEIMHPEKYFDGAAPETVTLPDVRRFLPPGWKRLDENIAGEFTTAAILKQFLDEKAATDSARPDGIGARAWSGDRYQVLENPAPGRTMVVFRTRWATASAAREFFEDYTRLLAKKHPRLRTTSRERNRFAARPEASAKDAGVFVRTRGRDVLVVEGSSPATFAKIERAVWPAMRPAGKPAKKPVLSAESPTGRETRNLSLETRLASRISIFGFRVSIFTSSAPLR